MSYSLLNRSATKARKEHACMWCGHPVIAASRYVRETSVYDGNMQSFAFHEACMKANDEYFNDVGDGEFPEDAEMPFFALYQLETRTPSPQTREQALIDRLNVLEAALRRISKWFGEFPETGRFWDDEKTRQMTWAACYGSNGERDYMRGIAEKALSVAPALPSPETPLRVKPLVWHDARGDGSLTATTTIGLQYFVSEKAWGFRNYPDLYPVEGGIEVAKEEAQADYAARIIPLIDELAPQTYGFASKADRGVDDQPLGPNRNGPDPQASRDTLVPSHQSATAGFGAFIEKNMKLVPGQQDQSKVARTPVPSCGPAEIAMWPETQASAGETVGFTPDSTRQPKGVVATETPLLGEPDAWMDEWGEVSTTKPAVNPKPLYLHPPRGEPTPEMLVAGSMVNWSKYSDKAQAALDVWNTMQRNSKTVSGALFDVMDERRRQIESEGWTPGHDDAHSDGELARAASCYAYHGSWSQSDRQKMANRFPQNWPWERAWWKPTDARRDLVKAAALIIAEIERRDRATAPKSQP